jgi:hypothetical protein
MKTDRNSDERKDRVVVKGRTDGGRELEKGKEQLYKKSPDSVNRADMREREHEQYQHKQICASSLYICLVSSNRRRQVQRRTYICPP